MANSFIQVPTDGAGKLVDTRTTDVDGDHRQVIVLGDQATDAAIAEVLNTSPIAGDYGLVVRNTPGEKARSSALPTWGSPVSSLRLGRTPTKTAPLRLKRLPGPTRPQRPMAS